MTNKIEWQMIDDKQWVYRAKVPGRWLLLTVGAGYERAITFYPAPKHEWDGSPLCHIGHLGGIIMGLGYIIYRRFRLSNENRHTLKVTSI